MFLKSLPKWSNYLQEYNIVFFKSLLKNNICQIISVSRLSSVEVAPCENHSPFVKITLRTKCINDKEKETTINVTKDKLSELLSGTKMPFYY